MTANMQCEIEAAAAEWSFTVSSQALSGLD